MPPSHLVLGGNLPAPPPPRFPGTNGSGISPGGSVMPGNNSTGVPPGVVGSSHYSSSLLNPSNKFNTIHGNKRPLPSINQYESAAEARLGSGKDPAYYARGRDNYNSYHMSTLGRSSSMRTKEPLLGDRGALARGGSGLDSSDLGGRSHENGSSSNGSSSTANDSCSSSAGGKGQQVVDSAYGTTTRSAKKVYL